MSRSFIRLRRAMFGVSCTVIFGFGATDALAVTERDRQAELYCIQPMGGGTPYYTPYCDMGCSGGVAYCDAGGQCHCGYIP